MTIQKIFVYLLAFLLLSSGVVFAQTNNGTALPSPGITPESRFYFLDKFGEFIREFFTINPEGKARLQIAFAAERVAEIKIILETKGVEARGIGVAQSRLLAHLADAAVIVSEQKAGGEDVRALAKELDDEFEGPKSALEEAFKAKKQTLKAEEDELKEKIREARRAGDTAQVEALMKQLGEVKAEKELLEQKEKEQEEALEREEKHLEEEMEAKAKAEKAIREAEEEKQEVVDEAVKEGLIVPAEAFEKFDRFLAQAKELFDRGNYQGAKQLAKQAEKTLDAVEEAINDLEEAKEKEEELKEEQEEKEREAKEEQDEDLHKEAEKEAGRLEEEQTKAQEQSRKAEERLREAGNIDEDDED